MAKTGFLLLLAVLAVVPDSNAQEARNAVHFELGGSAIVPSFNYERRLNANWFGRIGASIVVGETEDDSDTTFVVPLTASHVGNQAANHHLELGGGLTQRAQRDAETLTSRRP